MRGDNYKNDQEALSAPGDRSSHLRAGQSQSMEGGQHGGRPGRGCVVLFDAPDRKQKG